MNDTHMAVPTHIGVARALAAIMTIAAVEETVNEGVILLASYSAGLGVLRELRGALDAVAAWEPAAIQSAVEAFAENRELGMGAVAQPLRIACTGTSVSPPIDATLASLGKEAVLARIDRAIEHLAAAPA